MQFDQLRAFPYPVLRPDIDDYVDGDIQVTAEFEPSADGQDVSASVHFLLSVPELVSAVQSKLAAYVLVVACRDTYFRHVEIFHDQNVTIQFPSGALRGEVQVFPYVAAIERVDNFTCSWINPEFGSGPFSFEVGSVLALDRPQIVFIDRDVFKPLSSIFELAKEDSITGHEWQIRPTSEKVRILVSPELKEKIDVARNNTSNRAVLMNSIYFSAVMQCVGYLKNEESEFAGSKWARVFKQKCHNENINIEEHEEHIVAQRLMRSPFRLIEAYLFNESLRS